MPRLATLLIASLAVGLLTGCSDLDSTSTGGTGGAGFIDPAPVTKTITLGCTNNLNTEVVIVDWDLTVDPGPIVGGEAFGAVLEGLVVFDESILDAAQTWVPGGYKRSIVLTLQATVHVRSGVAGDAVDVVLRPEPIPRTCAYDGLGRTGPDAGPFPPCSEANDNPDGSNTSCTGLGEAPDPRNVCGQFVTVPTSNDCDPGGLCESKGKTGPGSQCASNGFCVSDPLPVLLEAAHEGYLAADSGTVLFGWDDQSTGAELDRSGGANQGSWILPPTIFDDEPGPNGFRGTLGNELEAALDCTMAEGTPFVLWPVEDSLLISFPIQAR